MDDHAVRPAYDNSRLRPCVKETAPLESVHTEPQPANTAQTGRLAAPHGHAPPVAESYSDLAWGPT